MTITRPYEPSYLRALVSPSGRPAQLSETTHRTTVAKSQPHSNFVIADKKHAILLALQTWPERSGNQIAEQIGCQRRYVDQIRNQVGATTTLPDRVTGKDGKSYPASRPAAATRRDGRKLEKTPAAIRQRRERMREMAAAPSQAHQ